MSLHNIYLYPVEKTVKLNDSYSVYIKFSDIDKDILDSFLNQYSFYDSTLHILKLPECTNVTLPQIGFKEETYNYGNNSKLFLIPDYEKPTDLTIELFEHEVYSQRINRNFGLIQFLINILLNKLFDTETFTYKLLEYIEELNIIIYKNDFNAPVYNYIFKELKLSNYTKYNMSYNDANTCKWALTFSYNTYIQTLIESPKYTQGFNMSPLNINRYISNPFENTAVRRREPTTSTNDQSIHNNSAAAAYEAAKLAKEQAKINMEKMINDANDRAIINAQKARKQKMDKIKNNEKQAEMTDTQKREQYQKKTDISLKRTELELATNAAQYDYEVLGTIKPSLVYNNYLTQDQINILKKYYGNDNIELTLHENRFIQPNYLKGETDYIYTGSKETLQYMFDNAYNHYLNTKEKLDNFNNENENDK